METDKYIEVSYGNFVTDKQTVQVQIKMCYYYGRPFTATVYNIILAPNLCDQLFSMIMLINLVHTWLFRKVFGTVFFSDNEQKSVTLTHRTQRKHALLVKMKGKSESQIKSLKR